MRRISLARRETKVGRNRRARRMGCHFDTLENRSLLSGYSYQVLQTIPGNAPQGATWYQDFEPGDININGEIAYVADMSKNGSPIGEGFFVQDSQGKVTTLAFPGQSLPGGLHYGAFAFSQTSINDRGDSSVVLLLNLNPPPPTGSPPGVNAALFRGDAGSSTLTALVTPGMSAPGGGQFAGVTYTSYIDHNRDVIFGGIINEPSGGYGSGLFKVDAAGTITSVVLPGDPVPGGGSFDSARPGAINSKGDIAFNGHNDIFTPNIGDSVYLRDAAGNIKIVAQQGGQAPFDPYDPALGKTPQYLVAFDPKINDGYVVFTADVTPHVKNQGNDVGVYLYNLATGKTVAVAQPGEPMPQGGNFVRASYANGNVDINNQGDVTFSAVLDTKNKEGNPATGVYRWSNGTLTLIARSDMVISGVGQIADLNAPGFGLALDKFTTSGVVMNDHGQVVFQATLPYSPDTPPEDRRGVLLLATPN